MASIDLLALEPTVITRDLSNKYILLAAPYKFGKTTFMTNIPGALVLSFEPGLNARAGVYAQKITSWSDLKLVCRQLAKPEVMNKFKCVCFDTIEIAATMCQEFVCARAGVQSMGEVAYGKLYKEYELEFGKTIRSIAMLGYGCVFACHTEVKSIEVAPEVVSEQIRPKLDKRAFDIINGLVDIIGIGVMKFNDKGERHRVLYTAETPTIKAGNRFTYFPPVIEFSYQSVLDNLSEAIEAEATNNNATVVDKVEVVQEKLDYNAIRAEAATLWGELLNSDNDAENEEMARRIQKRIEMIFGRQIRLSEITEDQVDLFNLVLLDMRDLAAER
jgi:hypothetical protein